MVTKLMKKSSATAFSLMMACAVWTGCTDRDVYNPDRGRPELKPESEYFDFTTTSHVDFDVNYGKLAGGALLEFFTEDPVTYREDGSYSIDKEAVYKIFADENGRFKGKVELPKAAKQMYIISTNWGAPFYTEAEMENGKVTVDATKEDANTRISGMTRAAANLAVWKVSGFNDLYSAVKWDNDKYGRVNDVNKIISDGDLSNKTIQKIQKSLWNGKDSKPDKLNNSKYVTDTKHINTVIAKAYKNGNGETVTIEDAEVWLTFLSESGWNQNAIGYYYYPSDKVPTSAAEVKKYILFPNASIAGNVPYAKNKETSGSPYDFGKKNAPLTTNRKIQLLYEDENGVSTKFPSGYTIGYFIMPKDFKSTNNNTESTYKLQNTFIYSNNNWNSGQKSNFISLSTTEGTVVYGIEDGGDTSYEDVLFCIDANPNEAIQDPDRPIIDPEDPIITSKETTYRVYAYEDIWPNGGDYDLNDVIIEHTRAIEFNNNNYVLKVTDTYTPVQEDGAATYEDAFAVQYDPSQRGTIELPAGAVDETETSSVILFADAKTVKDQSFSVVRTFADKALNKNNLITEMNPFIIANYAVGANNRTEVHLPKQRATSKANAEQIGDEDDAYYINKDGKYPFAIMIPATTSSEGVIHFTPASERVRIDQEYPDFTKWVESKGATNNDWYLYYQSSK